MNNEELKLQSEMFLWHWNTFPEERGMLHANNNNSENKVKGNINRNMGVVAGVADLEYNHMATTVFIEVKTPTGSQSPKQVKFQKLMEAQGFVYKIVRTVEEFKSLILNERAKRGIVI